MIIELDTIIKDAQEHYILINHTLNWGPSQAMWNVKFMEFFEAWKNLSYPYLQSNCPLDLIEQFIHEKAPIHRMIILTWREFQHVEHLIDTKDLLNDILHSPWQMRELIPHLDKILKIANSPTHPLARLFNIMQMKDPTESLYMLCSRMPKLIPHLAFYPHEPIYRKESKISKHDHTIPAMMFIGNTLAKYTRNRDVILFMIESSSITYHFEAQHWNMLYARLNWDFNIVRYQLGGERWITKFAIHFVDNSNVHIQEMLQYPWLYHAIATHPVINYVAPKHNDLPRLSFLMMPELIRSLPMRTLGRYTLSSLGIV